MIDVLQCFVFENQMINEKNPLVIPQPSPSKKKNSTLIRKGKHNTFSLWKVQRIKTMDI